MNAYYKGQYYCRAGMHFVSPEKTEIKRVVTDGLSIGKRLCIEHKQWVRLHPRNPCPSQLAIREKRKKK